MQTPSVFTQILNGELPGEVIYQDGLSFVILTIEPLTPGHLLVIPRAETDRLWDVEGPLYRHLMDVTKEMAALIARAYNYERVGMNVEGFGVPHAHIHVYGLNEGIEPTMIRHAATKHFLAPEELKVEADKLRACL